MLCGRPNNRGTVCCGCCQAMACIPENTNWLLVFDNLDDPDLVDIGEYILACNHGTVIITSRRCGIQQGRRGFEVQQMQPTEGIELLLAASAMPKSKDLVSCGELKSTAMSHDTISELALSRANHCQYYSTGIRIRATCPRSSWSVYSYGSVFIRSISKRIPNKCELSSQQGMKGGEAG